MFDPLWQETREPRGIGLWLRIVKGIVKAHGGRIRIEDTPGRGTAFFALPAASGEEALAYALR